MSYPDLVEEGGNYYLTETQKDVARVHQIDKALLEGLWSQFDAKGVAREGLVLELTGAIPGAVNAPQLKPFYTRSKRADHGKQDLRTGFSLDVTLRLTSTAAGQVLLDNRTPDGRGFALVTALGGAVELVMNDGRTESRWESDAGTITAGKDQRITVIVDGGPKIVTFVTDGILNDGGEQRQFGWGRFSPHLKTVNGAGQLVVGRDVVKGVRIYSRALRTSEAIAAFRAGS